MKMIQFLPILEVLFFNLLTIDLCCHRRYSRPRTAAVLGIFSAILFAGAVLIPGSPLDGNGRFIILGVLVYLIPFRYVYTDKLSLLSVITYLSCVYTMGILALSIQLSGILGRSDSAAIAAAEAFLYLITFPLFFRQVIPKYIHILDSIQTFGRHWYKYLLLNSLIGFLLLTLLNNIFLESAASIRQAAALLLVLAMAYISCFILYRIIQDAFKMDQLQEAALCDPLTGLGNRTQLWNQLQASIDKEEVFSVIFMDLDHFKQINDQYGHMTGDRYLKHFSGICRDIVQGSGEVYRFGGDEFVILCKDIVSEEILDELKKCRKWKTGAPCPFNQVSLGTLVCRPPHGDPDQILHQVDHLMYLNKLEKNQARQTEN